MIYIYTHIYIYMYIQHPRPQTPQSRRRGAVPGRDSAQQPPERTSHKPATNPLNPQPQTSNLNAPNLCKKQIN